MSIWNIFFLWGADESDLGETGGVDTCGSQDHQLLDLRAERETWEVEKGSLDQFLLALG